MNISASLSLSLKIQRDQGTTKITVLSAIEPFGKELHYFCYLKSGIAVNISNSLLLPEQLFCVQLREK
jgi:hypothetical protein